MTYSYDPTKIGEFGLDRMRFELGDTDIREPETNAFLSDEEILSALASTKSFKRAKLKLLESLLARFSYEVDTKVDTVSFSLHQRVDALQKLYNRTKAEVTEEELCESSALKVSSKSRPPIFTVAMHDWRSPCFHRM